MRALAQLAIVLLCITCGMGRAFAEPIVDNRFLIVVGSNMGLANDDLLRFAESDAERLRDLIVELGGVPADRAYLVQGGDREELRRKISEVRGRVAELQSMGRSSTLMFYFSGHGDGEAIHLGSSLFTLDELRRELATIPAKLQITLLDACRTGGRLKGITRGPPVKLVLGPEGPHGTVELRASSEGEAAQESEELEGAIFTHFLVSGMRGAADMDGDGGVTLGELYTYVYRLTLRRSSTAQVIQHPELTEHLGGAGDIVLTRPKLGSAFLDVPASAGRYLIFSLPSSRVVGELAGVGASRLAVPPGRLLVVRQQGEDTRVAEIDLSWGGSRVLSDGDFRPIAREQLVTRGGRLALQSLQIDEAVGLEWASKRAETMAVSTALRIAYLRTFEYALEGRFVAGDVSIPTGPYVGDARTIGLSATMGVRVLWQNRARVTFAIGPEVRWSWQHLDPKIASKASSDSRPTEDSSFSEIGARTALRFGVPVGRDMTVSGEAAFSPLLRRERDNDNGKTSLAIHTILAGNLSIGYAF